MRRAPILSALILLTTFISIPQGEASTSTTFSWTGSTTTFTVPAGVLSLTVEMRGAGGGMGGTDGHPGGTPGNAVGRITGTISVTPSQVISIAVGQGGGSTSACLTNAGAGAAGLNLLAGFDGATGGNAGTTGCSGGGGGATVIIISGVNVVAGGGGGSGGGNNVSLSSEQNSKSGAQNTGSTSGSTGTRPTGDGGGGGGGGGGAVGGAGGTSAKISSSREFYGYGGNAGTSSTGGVSGLSATTYTDTAATKTVNGSNGYVTFSYAIDTTAPTITGPSSVTGATSSISIGENSTAVHTFTANESVTWSNSGTDSSFFSITSSGVLTITARDFEAPADVGSDNTYAVVISATDASENATNQTLTVTVTDVNEAPVISINGSATTHSITQAENISSVITYTGSDVDTGTTLTWSLSGTDSMTVIIGAASGVLSFASNPDFEAPSDSDQNNTYIFIVTLSDGTLTDTQTVTINITNADETASLGTPSLSATPLKGNLLTITVTSTVAGKITFLVGGKRIVNCLARPTTGTYPSFSATCSWKPTVMNRQSVTARITPTDNTFSATTSAPVTFLVGKRSGTR